MVRWQLIAQRLRVAATVLASLLLAACATPQTDALRSAPPSIVPAALLESVPFFAQDEYQCGPASLAMALAATGTAATPEALRAQVYLPDRLGSLQAEMLATARRHARLAVPLAPRLHDVLREVADGRPVIVLQNLSLPIAPVWHYAVVIGYDLGRGEIVLHSGPTAGMRLPLEVFERTWARSGHWSMVAVSPERLPLTPDLDMLLRAAAALERVDPVAAGSAYGAIVERAPSASTGWIGLGNTRYRSGDPAGAAAAFRRATEIDPRSSEAWNNLALAALGSGRRDEARAAVERAIAIGGVHRVRYRQTLARIEASR